MSSKITRREFIKGAAVAGVGAYGISSMPLDVLAATNAPRSRVVIVDSPNVLVSPKTNENTIDKLHLKAAGAYDLSIDMKILMRMVDQAVQN
ncbi:MAG: twin-arginine translocation signal domain-containing protein, partial [Armatimonadota bacterium]